jgi:hypothetical protein
MSYEILQIGVCAFSCEWTVAVKTFLTCSNKIINTSLCRDSREKYFNSFITLGGGDDDRAISRNEIWLLKQTNIIAANAGPPLRRQEINKNTPRVC